jgi:hypothetical protein
MQIVADPDTGLGSDPHVSVNQSNFPRRTLAGDLIGVTGNGHGVYLQEATAELWQRDESWESTTTYIVTRAVPENGSHPEFDTVFCPPQGETLEEASVTLDGGIDELATHILELTDNQGPWMTLTDRGWETLARSEIQLDENVGPSNSDDNQGTVSEVTTDD